MSNKYNVDETRIKKPNQEAPLTKKQAEEWLKCADDIYYWLANYAYVEGAGGKQLFTARSYQQRAIDTSEDQFVIGLWPRQAGKTTTFGLIKLHSVIFNKNRHIGITSYKLSNCKDYIKRIKFTYENLPWFMKPAVKIYNVYEIEFTNESSIQSQVTTETTFRGLTLTDVVIDELAFVSEKVAGEFWSSLLPSISADGENSEADVTIISTPNGTAGTFAGIWAGAKNGMNGFTPIEAKYEEIPGRTEAFKKSMISKIGKEKFLQEFCCHFISNKGTLVNSQTLESLRTKEPVETIKEDLRIFTDDFRGRTIVMACDVGDGVGQDYHAIQIYDLNTLEQLGEFQNNMMNQTMYTKEIIKIIKWLYEEKGAYDIYYTIENNAIGAGVMRLIENANEPSLEKATLISDIDGKRLGIYTTNKNKLAGCTQLKDLIEEGKLTINSDRLVTELKFFVKRGASYAAEDGANDDLAMSMVLLMNTLMVLVNYEDSVYDTMNEINITEDEGDEVWGIAF